MINKSIKISAEDMECLWMLWRWKLLTTSALQASAYRSRNLYGCYCRLIDLEKKDIVISTSSWDQNTIVWHLGEAGYRIVSTQFQCPAQGGFRSENKDHDFWVSAIHLGEWIHQLPENCAMFSEQELRKLDIEHYPTWVPQTKRHRPDGWWNIDIGKTNGESLIALEVEFSKKTSHAYGEVGDFYSNAISVYQVIWVVKTKSDINYILSHLKKGSSSQAQEQSFITLDQYVQHQWNSQIIVGKNQGKKLSEILSTSSQHQSNSYWSNVLLDVRKRPIISTAPNYACKAELGLSRQY